MTLDKRKQRIPWIFFALVVVDAISLLLLLFTAGVWFEEQE